MFGVCLRIEMIMHCYIVLYDLCKPGQNYERLYMQLRNYERWGRLTESAWAIVTSKNYIQLRDELKMYIDENDRLLVVRSGQEAAWNNLMASTEWIRENIVL